MSAGIKPTDDRGRYLHWDEVRNRTPPGDLTRLEWWTATKLARNPTFRSLPLTSVTGDRFHFSNVDVIQAAVHRIDQQASGHIQLEGASSLPKSERYVVSSLVEEAITSSQLEGASTTRRVAKEMLLNGRKPRTISERMIFNNYRAMLTAQAMAHEALTPQTVLELQRELTVDTDLDPSEVGRMQTPEDQRVTVQWGGVNPLVLHVPPTAQELPGRLSAMTDFANGSTTDGFVHPVVRAIVLHFWLSYDHPFADGNGRSARALFYWSMLRSGYWLAQYVSISSILRLAPAQYARSFLYAETDSGDMTYFIIYQLSVIERAIASLIEYLNRKMTETQDVERLIHHSPALNHRQVDVVREALRDPDRRFTIAAQRTEHRVTYQTARTDLLRLEDLGLMERSSRGNAYVFTAPRDLEQRLRRLSTAHDSRST